MFTRRWTVVGLGLAASLLCLSACIDRTPATRVPMPDAELQILIDGEPVYDAYLATLDARLTPGVRLKAPAALQRIIYEDETYSLQSEKLEWSASAGSLTRRNRQDPEWTLPDEVGDYRLTVTLTRRYVRVSTSTTPDTMETGVPDIVEFFISDEVYALVPAPASDVKDGEIEGYRIGEYPDLENPSALAVRTHKSLYQPPTHFYRVTEENQHYRITKRFRLGDFDMNFDYMPEEVWPNYVVLDPVFVAKLELVIDELNRAGYPVTTFKMISGFRPPSYNEGSRQQGADLKAGYSRHMWGDAADFIVDEDHDDVMDDLNRDGVVDCDDARIVFLAGRVIDEQLAKRNSPAVGGRGLYARHDALERDVQTPYVHMDARGYVHSDGRLYEWFEECAP